MSNRELKNLDKSSIINNEKRASRTAHQGEHEEETANKTTDHTPKEATEQPKTIPTKEQTTSDTKESSTVASLSNLSSIKLEAHTSAVEQPTYNNVKGESSKSLNQTEKPKSIRQIAKDIKRQKKQQQEQNQGRKDRQRLGDLDFTSTLPPYWRLPNTDSPITDWFETNKHLLPKELTTNSRANTKDIPYKPFNMDHTFKSELSEDESSETCAMSQYGPKVVNEPGESYDIIEYPLIKAYAAETNNTDRESLPEVAENGESATAFSIDRLNAQLKAMSYKIPNFSGDKDSDDISEFLKDLNKYFRLTKVTEDLEKYSIMKNNLSGTAKIWLRLQPDHLKWKDLEEAIKQRFQLTEQQKHMKKLGIYSLTQEPGETYVEFCTRVQSKGRRLNITDQDLLSVCLSGAKETLKPHLIMAQPTSIDQLLRLPLARNEAFADTTKEFVNMTDMMTEINNVNRTSLNQGSSAGKRVNWRRETDKTDDEKQQNKPKYNPQNEQNSGTYGLQQNKGQDTQWCNSCGSYNCPAILEQGTCIAEGKNCLYCNKKNHFANVCRLRISRKYSPKRVNETGFSKPVWQTQERWIDNTRNGFQARPPYRTPIWNRDRNRGSFRNGRDQPWRGSHTGNGYRQSTQTGNTQHYQRRFSMENDHNRRQFQNKTQ